MKMRLVFVWMLVQLSCVSAPWIKQNPTQADRTGQPPAPEISATPSSSGADPTLFETPAVSADARRREEYALYKRILEEMLLGSQIQCIVLKDHTTLGYMSDEDEKTMEYLRGNLPGVTEDLLEGFFAQNREPVMLTPPFKVDVPVFLLSTDEMAEFFSSENGGGWERFYETFKGAQGVMEFSQAWFNAGMDQALVYAGNQSYYLAGAGHLHWMEKQDGTWTTRNTVMVWIS